MKREIAEWVSKCYTCQRVKAEHQRPSGLLQPLEIPEWKWEHIAMDFIVGLPRTKANHDAIWVIVDRLTKSAHFLPINERFSLDKLVHMYLKEIVVRHGVPVSILSPRYVGPFEILRRVGKVAYELALPPQMEHIHNVFHESMLKKYNPDSRHVIEYEPIELEADLSYVERPVEILDRREKVLRNKVVNLVRVLWRNPKVEESTWELESDMREKYPHLFT
ncbi:hypothetical protein DCAR_0623422 [Daucus carota subsp. sativus]|uniref:Tf2-1-like SH3-like domain-containing protein n=1 Tax=Daucus carota subsp. sativus TaxID=79200 RepID=A0AAF0XBG1_DAUCS|nr:hypothetical protein DCAR_0623422 [Daucus carota subsp. sativus]